MCSLFERATLVLGRICWSPDYSVDVITTRFVCLSVCLASISRYTSPEAAAAAMHGKAAAEEEQDCINSQYVERELFFDNPYNMLQDRSTQPAVSFSSSFNSDNHHKIELHSITARRCFVNRMTCDLSARQDVDDLGREDAYGYYVIRAMSRTVPLLEHPSSVAGCFPVLFNSIVPNR